MVKMNYIFMVHIQKMSAVKLFYAAVVLVLTALLLTACVGCGGKPVIYLYPEETDEELLRVCAEEEKILHYFDIPIQHINNRVLKRMGRHNTKEETVELYPYGCTMLRMTEMPMVD